MYDKEFIHARFLLNRSNFNLDIDLKLLGHGVTVIQGPSGAGKTTILRCIAGLEQSNEGYLWVNGKLWQNNKFSLPTYKRQIGYVFQEDSLFDHLRIKKNILFGSKDKHRISAQLLPIIQMLGINHLLNRKPAELSGGERQRVAIARSLAIEPELLLMDEPLSSLDTNKKNEILNYINLIKNIWRIPIIYITHDNSEAQKIADKIIYLKNGKIIF